MHLSGVRPSVRPSALTLAHSSKPAAAGLLLWARWAGDIDRSLGFAARRTAARRVRRANAGSATLLAYVGG